MDGMLRDETGREVDDDSKDRDPTESFVSSFSSVLV